MLTIFLAVAIFAGMIALFCKLSLMCITAIGKIAWFCISAVFTIIGFFLIGPLIFAIVLPVIFVVIFLLLII